MEEGLRRTITNHKHGGMEFAEYTDAARQTESLNNLDSVQWPVYRKIIYFALKLSGETGEFNEKLGKLFRDSGGSFEPEYRTAMLKELGDILWYVDGLANALDSSLEEVAMDNLKKLATRKAEGKLHGSGDNR